MKRKSLRIFFASLLAGCLCMPMVSFARPTMGGPSAYVNDFAGVLTAEQETTLNNKLATFNASTTNEIAVVTVKSMDGDYIEHYAAELFKVWGIGTKKEDNGVLLLVAVDDRQMRIEVGYGLEGTLTDAVSAQIIRDDLTPAFKQGDYYGGIDRATNSIIGVTRGEYKPEVTESLIWLTMALLVIFFQKGFIIVVIAIFVASALGQSKSWWLGGVFGVVAGVVLSVQNSLGYSPESVGTTAVLGVLGLVFDFLLSKSYAKSVSAGKSPWWSPRKSGGGGSSGGGSSFGGFGGGSSGGGGASGRW